MSKKFDELFREIVTILRQDYAGAGLLADSLDTRYYNQAIGQAWHDEKLDELLFLRYVSQMLACTGDRHLGLARMPSADYTPWGPGFFTRLHQDSLYVTAVTADRRFQPGDRIVAVNGAPPPVQRQRIQKNFFYGSDPEREDWNGLLKMAQSIDLLRPDGRAERLELGRFAPTAPAPAPGFRLLGDGIVYLCPGPFDGQGTAQELVEQHQAQLTGCKALILDMRLGQGGEEEDFWPLLPYVCKYDTPLSQLVDRVLMVNYTRRNCLIKAAALQGIPGGREYIQELVEKSGKGFLPEEQPETDIIPGKAPQTVIVLTDTWCRDEGERFVQAAQRAGAVLLGRATAGTIDFCADVHYAIDERFVLTWPTAVTKAAYEGHGLLGKGIEPAIYVPWTPAECTQDVLLDRAAAYIREQA
jgi:hypothetical protein